MLRVSNIATAMGQQLVGSPTLTVSGVCCQNRVLHKEIAPGRVFFYHLLASIIWFLIFEIFTVVSL